MKVDESQFMVRDYSCSKVAFVVVVVVVAVLMHLSRAIHVYLAS